MRLDGFSGRRPDEGQVVAGGHDFEMAALERAHFDHVVQVDFEQLGVHEIGIRAGQVKAARGLPGGRWSRWRRPARGATA